MRCIRLSVIRNGFPADHPDLQNSAVISEIQFIRVHYNQSLQYVFSQSRHFEMGPRQCPPSTAGIEVTCLMPCTGLCSIIRVVRNYE